MQVDLTSIDELTNALRPNKTNGLACANGFTLGAAMKLAVWVQGMASVPSIVNDWSSYLGVFGMDYI